MDGVIIFPSMYTCIFDGLTVIHYTLKVTLIFFTEYMYAIHLSLRLHCFHPGGLGVQQSRQPSGMDTAPELVEHLSLSKTRG